MFMRDVHCAIETGRGVNMQHSLLKILVVSNPSKSAETVKFCKFLYMFNLFCCFIVCFWTIEQL